MARRTTLKEGDELDLQFFGDKVINVELPKIYILEVTYTEDVVKGDTTSSVLKDATLENWTCDKSASVYKTGDVISVDATTGDYTRTEKIA